MSESIGIGEYFECPECKSDSIDEVMVNVTVSSEITDLNIVLTRGADGKKVPCVDTDYAIKDETNPTLEDGEIDHYQCMRCCYVLKDDNGKAITTPEELYEWLIEHEEKREKELNTP